MRAHDAAVLIVGGGPAGLATAMELVRRHISAVVVERSSYDDIRIGEHLTPAGVMQLKALNPGLPAHLHCPSAGVIAYWGSETASYMDYFLHPGQRGLNLRRPSFDAELAMAAETCGAVILRSAIVRRTQWTGSSWYTKVRLSAGTDRVVTQVVVDATGRAATFARGQGARVRAYDREVALVAIYNDPNPTHYNNRSIVETTETGWWYAAPINSTRSICMLVTDHDLLPRGPGLALRAWWLDHLSRTKHIPPRLWELSPLNELIVRSARSQRLDVQSGPGWLAVGDAAMAFDPLASQGIAKAFDCGRKAAAYIAAYLAGDRLALERLALQFDHEYAAYRTIRNQYYKLETRWPASIFWTRRYNAVT